MVCIAIGLVFLTTASKHGYPVDCGGFGCPR